MCTFIRAVLGSSFRSYSSCIAVLATAASLGCIPSVNPSNNPSNDPAITTQPADQTVTAGQTATFTVAATGTAPLNYQWTKNGTNISGATSASYTTPATTTADNSAQFRVVVSNSAGSVTSNSATLTVNGSSTPQVATPTISPPSTTFTSPQNVTVTISTTTSGATIYYTTDRSNPTTASTRYTASFTVSSSSFVQAIATAPGMTNSGVARATYVTNTPQQYAEPLKVGAGGMITGIDIDPTGTTYVLRTDTFGAYVGDGTDAWQQVVNAASMPPSFVSSFTTGTRQTLGSGVYEARVAPSDPNRLYMIYMGEVYKSTDRGSTWDPATTGYVAGGIDPNDSRYRFYGQKMAVDPVNPDVVYAGAQGGLYVTTNGGGSWSRVASVSAPTSGDISGIAFDGSSGTTGGRTNIVYACSNGVGVYKSDLRVSGGAFTLLAGGPTRVRQAAANGAYYAGDYQNSHVYRYMNESWTDLVVNNSHDDGTIGLLDVDPKNPARIIAVRDSGNVSISTDQGATWTPWNWSMQVGDGDIAWVQNANYGPGPFVGLTGGRFDPIAANKLWASTGVGVSYTDPTTATTTWHARSAGIEQLVALDIAVPPGSASVVTAGMDRSVFVVSRENTSYPSDYVKMNSTAALILASSVDYSRANPAHLVALINHGGMGEPEVSGYSLDGGATWNVFPAQPGSGGVSGDIIATSIDNIIAVIGHRYAYRSTDLGQSWTPLSLPEDSGADNDNLHGGYGVRKHILAVDGADQNTVYLYFYTRGVYRSTNTGASWTRVNTSSFDGGNMYWQVKLRSVPGQAGHLFLTAGQAGGAGQMNPQDTSLWRSTDGGENWTTVAGFAEPYDIALGAPAPGQTYPAIYVLGWYNNDYGLWRSNDNAATWKKLTTFPFGHVDLVTAIAASQDAFGEVYFAFEGSGWGKLVDSIP